MALFWSTSSKYIPLPEFLSFAKSLSCLHLSYALSPGPSFSLQVPSSLVTFSGSLGSLYLQAEGTRCCCSLWLFAVSLILQYIGSFQLLHQLMIQGHYTSCCLQLFQGLLWSHSAGASVTSLATLSLETYKPRRDSTFF
jgi:hypothetical protein